MKTSARRRAREFVLQGLYQWMLSGNEPATIRANLAETGAFGKCDRDFFDRLWTGVTGEFSTMVAIFAPHLDRVPKELSPIEKAILVIGAFEIVRHPDVPYRVAINEAVELAKTYGGTDGYRYVNAVLDKLASGAAERDRAANRVAF